jgi:hypothetical protein
VGVISLWRINATALSQRILSSMMYRARTFTAAMDILGVEDFEAENDGAAILFAGRHLLSWIGMRLEIWQGDRLVHDEVYGPLPRDTGSSLAIERRSWN